MTKTSTDAASSTSSTVLRARRDLVAQPHRVDPEVRLRRIRFGMLLHHRRVNRAQFGARLLERRARRQPAEQLRHPMDAPGHHRRRQMMRAGDDVGDDLGFRRIRHRRFQHADDGRRRVPSRTVLPSTDGSLFSAVVQKR